MSFFMSRNRPFHKSCHKEQHHPKCDVCQNFIQTKPSGLIQYRAHPFWMQKYCPSHEYDMTPRLLKGSILAHEVMHLAHQNWTHWQGHWKRKPCWQYGMCSITK